MVGVLQHRQVRRHVQRELPAGLAVGFGGGARGGHDVFRKAQEFLLGRREMRECVRRVEHVVAELRRQFRQAFGDGLEAGLGGGVQLGATEAEVPQAVVDDALPRGRQRTERGAGAKRLVLAIEPLVLRQLGAVLRELRQVRVVDLAQRRAVHHGVHVRDLAPGAIETLVGILEGLDEVVPRGFGDVGRDAIDERAVLREELVDGRGDEPGGEFGIARQVGEIEQWIHRMSLDVTLQGTG